MRWKCRLCNRVQRTRAACATPGCMGLWIAADAADDDDPNEERLVAGDAPDGDDEDSGDDDEAPLVAFRDLRAAPLVRVRTGLAGWDDATSGGLPRGSVVLVGGEAGCGKSTDVLRIVGHVEGVFVSLEMNDTTLREVARASGARTDGIHVTHAHRVEQLVSLLERERPRVLGVDSLPKVVAAPHRPRSLAGMLSALEQLREAAEAVRACVLVVVQANKSGEFAGGEDLLHEADGLVWLSRKTVETSHKWRFGPERVSERDGLPGGVVVPFRPRR